MSNNNYNKQPLDLTDSNVEKSDDEAIGFLLNCVERGENLDNQGPPPICKVSRIHRDLSESSFTPQLVSIGPIHREDPKLIEFEWQKERYLNDLLKRCHNSTPKKTLEACLLKVKTLIPKIRESYAGVRNNYSDDELARMMVMDGCFILEFCFKHEENLYFPNKMQKFRIAMDLMLLENQVPFVVLQGLFDCLAPCIFKKKGSVTLRKVLDTYLAPYIKLYRSQLREEIPTTDVDSDSTHDHVLGYLHRRYQLVAAKSLNSVYAKAFRRHTIVELDRSGMKFKPHQEDVWSMTIKFQSSLLASWFGSKATLLMPTLVIDEFTELILRNFIAYEQSFPQDHYYFSSYAHAMDMLIDTQEDIAKLVESEVLVNTLCSNQEAADMINKICKNIFVNNFCYAKEFNQMNEYYNRYWSKNIIAWLSRDFARVRHAYLNNSWKVIAVLGALVLFGLTMIQTIYTIRAA